MEGFIPQRRMPGFIPRGRTIYMEPGYGAPLHPEGMEPPGYAAAQTEAYRLQTEAGMAAWEAETWSATLQQTVPGYAQREAEILAQAAANGLTTATLPTQPRLNNGISTLAYRETSPGITVPSIAEPKRLLVEEAEVRALQASKQGADPLGMLTCLALLFL